MLMLGGCKLGNHRSLDGTLGDHADSVGVWALGDANDANTYLKGPATLDAGKVKTLTIDWIKGPVNVVESTSSEVSVREFASDTLSDFITLHYTLTSEGELKICFGKPGAKIEAKDMPEKTLWMGLPRTLCLDEVVVNGVSQELSMRDVCCKCLETNGVTDCVSLNRCSIGRLESNSVSGKLTAAFLQLPEEIELNNVNGSATLLVLPDAGMTVELEGCQLHSNLPFRRKGKAHIRGNGACQVEVNSVAGEFFVKRNTSFVLK